MKKLIFFYGLIIFIIIMSAVIYYELSSGCDAVDFVNMSLGVKSGSGSYIGLNGDTDSLKFGKVSPGSEARKFIKVKYAQDADVEIAAESNAEGSNFASWVTITPNLFELKAGEEKEVTFQASVPEDALDGNYEGEVVLCYKEK